VRLKSITYKIVDIYEGCRNEKFNDVVLSHEFLNCEPLRMLFHHHQVLGPQSDQDCQTPTLRQARQCVRSGGIRRDGK
jgi:hypothetical protein